MASGSNTKFIHSVNFKEKEVNEHLMMFMDLLFAHPHLGLDEVHTIGVYEQHEGSIHFSLHSYEPYKDSGE